MFDIVIRGGSIIDGTGGPAFIGDVGIDGHAIAAVGANLGSGALEIDATGKIVTPGFIDVHTHYDAQAVWSKELTPSSWHGVTTCVMGNCGVGFAPCRPEQRDMLIELMEGVEDLPRAVLAEGLTWRWESFPEYLDALQAKPFDIDVAAQLPHAALRVYVMGERGARREPATQADRDEMGRLAAEAMNAGAIGFSTSRSVQHKASDGTPTPTLHAAESELMAIAQAMGQVGKGVLQVVSDFDDPAAEFGLLNRLTLASGRPLSISLSQRESHPERWREVLDMLSQAVREGSALKAQVCGRAIGLMFGLELSENPFASHPSYLEIAELPLPERLALMRRPDVRAKILAEAPGDPVAARRFCSFDKIFEMGDPPEYEPPAEASLAARALRAGIAPQQLAYELMTAGDGKAVLYRPLLNYVDGNFDVVEQLMANENTVMGMSDGGAQVGMICDASVPTFMLEHWGKRRTRGSLMSLPRIVAAQTRETAAMVGLLDRGLLLPGYKADVNVIDFDALALEAPYVAYDMPLGGRRLMQRARGYEATLVSGVLISRHGVRTGAYPGQLVRGHQPAPVAAAATAACAVASAASA